jgi:hypothetical protein
VKLFRKRWKLEKRLRRIEHRPNMKAALGNNGFNIIFGNKMKSNKREFYYQTRFPQEHDTLEEEMKLVTKMHTARIHTEGDEIGGHILVPSFLSKRTQNLV